MSTLTLPAVTVRATRVGNRTVYERACSRCGVFRQVRKPRDKKNLCEDCVFVLTLPEIRRWVA